VSQCERFKPLKQLEMGQRGEADGRGHVGLRERRDASARCVYLSATASALATVLDTSRAFDRTMRSTCECTLP